MYFVMKTEAGKEVRIKEFFVACYYKKTIVVSEVKGERRVNEEINIDFGPWCSSVIPGVW